MSPIVLVALRKWRELRPCGPDELVFATRNKKPLSDGNLLKRYVYPACDRLKIPRVSWHIGVCTGRCSLNSGFPSLSRKHSSATSTQESRFRFIRTCFPVPKGMLSSRSTSYWTQMDSSCQNRATEEIEIDGNLLIGLEKEQWARPGSNR